MVNGIVPAGTPVTTEHRLCSSRRPGGRAKDHNVPAGNLTNDPVFVSASNANYRLSRESPCLNTGTNQAWMIGGVDLDGNPRIKQSRVDMGTYELPPALGTILELR